MWEKIQDGWRAEDRRGADEECERRRCARKKETKKPTTAG
jgi:hypothetical protein